MISPTEPCSDIRAGTSGCVYPVREGERYSRDKKLRSAQRRVGLRAVDLPRLEATGRQAKRFRVYVDDHRGGTAAKLI